MKKLFTFFALSAIVLGMASCGGDEPESQIVVNPNSKKGMMPGRFTVDDEGTQVRFSQGNLQFNANLGENGTWRFATHQWDTVGKLANSLIGTPEATWIDLFGWGTGNNPTNTSNLNSDYPGYNEWGENAIANGGNNTGQWRTLSSEEWTHLFRNRKNAANLFGLGTIAGVPGVILLPDEWEMPMEAPGFKASTKYMKLDESGYCIGDDTDHQLFERNKYNAEQWDVMEKAGAIFLPAAGCRYQKGVSQVGTNGNYWTSTHGSNPYSMKFENYRLMPKVISMMGRPNAYSVRLVR